MRKKESEFTAGRRLIQGLLTLIAAVVAVGPIGASASSCRPRIRIGVIIP